MSAKGHESIQASTGSTTAEPAAVTIDRGLQSSAKEVYSVTAHEHEEIHRPWLHVLKYEPIDENTPISPHPTTIVRAKPTARGKGVVLVDVQDVTQAAKCGKQSGA